MLEEEEDVLPEGVPPPSDKHLEALQNYFGHSSFRPMQWKIIHAVLQVTDQHLMNNLHFYYHCRYGMDTYVYIFGWSLLIDLFIFLHEMFILSQ